jgi:glycosyltransferase involved in cell wall biosynthesis
MKLAFLAHEFGIFPGHGGIASYLFQIVTFILENCHDHQVDVICHAHGKSDDVKSLHPDRFRLHTLDGLGDTLSRLLLVRTLLMQINPDIVEVADYLGLAKLAALDKQYGLGFHRTVFVTNHHTASQEIYEWCNEVDAALSPRHVKQNIVHERDQMLLVDANIAPSSFLARYVRNRYRLSDEVEVFPNPYNVSLQRQADVRRECRFHDPEEGSRKFVIVLLTRFEPRKNQARLVREFSRFLRILQAEGEPIEGIELHMAGNSVTMEIGGQDYRQYVYGLVPAEFTHNVHFYDFLHLEEQQHLIAIADLAVMPSTFENFPVAMIETVLRDIPVMGSKFSGVADYSRHDADILTFDPFEDGHLSRNILAFYRLDSTTRVRLLVNQQRELRDLVNPDNSVYKRLRFFESLHSALPERSDGMKHQCLFILDPSADRADDIQGLDCHMTCGTFLALFGHEFVVGQHVSLCLLSGPCVPTRLRAVVAATPSEHLRTCVVGFTTDGDYARVLDVLGGGFPLWLPCVHRADLAGHEPDQPLFEVLISLALERHLVVDSTAARTGARSRKCFTEYCFRKTHGVLRKRALEAI